MTTKYTTGNYHLHLFDKHGVKLETRDHAAFVPARDEGERLIKAPPVASYAVTRVLANSIDQAYPWTRSVTEEVDEC